MTMVLTTSDAKPITTSERPVDALAVTSDQLDLIRRTIAKDATPDELKLYLFDCHRQGVHPLDKLIHFTKRDGKYTPITSIDFMRIRAADSGEMAGSDDPVFTSHDDALADAVDTATVTVYRLTQGQRFAYTATARWDEYKPAPGPSGRADVMWRKMPHTMLGKCAEALALRKGFPRQLAGLYAKEEMDQAEAPVPGRGNSPAGESLPTTAVPSVPNGGDSGVNTTTGEVYPPGFAPIDDVKDRGAFLDVSWGRDAQGGSRVLTTRVPHIRNAAQAAYDDGVPVRLSSKDGKYLDGVERVV